MPMLLEHKELLASQSASKTLLEWCAYFDNQYTKSQIYSFCYHNGYLLKKLSQEEKTNNAKKYNINQNFFKTWNSNMAYIFGFWYATGYIYGGKIFDISIHKKDKYILKKIAENLKYKGQLYDYVDQQSSRLNFSCKTIYNDLIALGGKENKNLDLVFPEVPKEYLSDFIRGYFDGNGCIMNLKNNRINSTFTCKSKEFLDKLLLILKEEAKIEGGSYDPSSYSLKFGKKDSIKLGQFMYKNNPELFLQRKKNKFIIL